MKPPAHLRKTGARYYFPQPAKYRDRCRTVLGARWDRSGHCWYIPNTPFACESLDQRFEVLDPEPPFRYQVVLAELIRQGFAAQDPGQPSSSWEHQRKALDWMCQLMGTGGGALLYFDMGTGKTKIALDFIVQRNLKRILVAAPLAVLPAWEKQANLHYPGLFDVLVLNKGSGNKRAERMREAVSQQGVRPLLVVVNYEIVWKVPMDSTIMLSGFDMVIADESHKLKGRSSAVSNYFRTMSEWVEYRLALTGTPLSNGALSDAFGQYCFLDPGIFGTSIARFEDEYAVKPTGQNFVVGWKNQDRFDEKFWLIARHEDKNVLDLPELVSSERTFELQGSAARLYHEVAKELIGAINVAKEEGVTETKLIWATNAAVRVGKLQQITSGAVLVDEEVQPVHDQRLVLLHELLEDLGDQPVVVFAKYVADLVMIHEAARRAKFRSWELSGAKKELEEWQSRSSDGRDVLVVQIDSGSLGIDLTRASVGIFFSIGYSLSTYVQAIARLHRPGQLNSTHLIHLIATGTVDESIYRSIEKKGDLVQGVIDAYSNPDFLGDS